MPKPGVLSHPSCSACRTTRPRCHDFGVVRRRENDLEEETMATRSGDSRQPAVAAVGLRRVGSSSSSRG